MKGILEKIKKIKLLQIKDREALKGLKAAKKAIIINDIAGFNQFDLSIKNAKKRIEDKDSDIALLQQTSKEFIQKLSKEQISELNEKIQNEINQQKEQEEQLILRCAELEISMQENGLTNFPDAHKISKKVKELKKAEKQKQLNEMGNNKELTPISSKKSKKVEIKMLQAQRKIFYDADKNWKPAAKLLFKKEIDFAEMEDLLSDKKQTGEPVQSPLAGRYHNDARPDERVNVVKNLERGL